MCFPMKQRKCIAVIIFFDVRHSNITVVPENENNWCLQCECQIHSACHSVPSQKKKSVVFSSSPFIFQFKFEFTSLKNALH